MHRGTHPGDRGVHRPGQHHHHHREREQPVQLERSSPRPTPSSPSGTSSTTPGPPTAGANAPPASPDLMTRSLTSVLRPFALCFDPSRHTAQGEGAKHAILRSRATDSRTGSQPHACGSRALSRSMAHLARRESPTTDAHAAALSRAATGNLRVGAGSCARVPPLQRDPGKPCHRLIMCSSSPRGSRFPP